MEAILKDGEQVMAYKNGRPCEYNLDDLITYGERRTRVARACMIQRLLEMGENEIVMKLLKEMS